MGKLTRWRLRHCLRCFCARRTENIEPKRADDLILDRDHPPVEDFSLLADSQIIPFAEAFDMTGQFGGHIAYLNDTRRFDARTMAQTVPFSLPVERLPCSKERVQTAI